MGWKLRFVSSCGRDFNYDFDVSFRAGELAAGRASYNYHHCDAGLPELAGDSVFYRDAGGQIFRSYAAFGCGGAEFLGIYRFLDATPNGRAEHGPCHRLVDWARLHPSYGQGEEVECNGRYHAEGCGCCQHGQR